MKTTSSRILLTALLAWVLGSPAMAGAADRQIRLLDAQWSQAAGQKDAAKTASFYAEDASLMAFNAPLVTGKAKIQDAWAALMAKPGFALHFEPTRIVVAKAADLAYDLGTFQLTLNDAQGKPTTIVGKYLVAWAKQKDGSWKAAADCFNTDQ